MAPLKWFFTICDFLIAATCTRHLVKTSFILQVVPAWAPLCQNPGYTTEPTYYMYLVWLNDTANESEQDILFKITKFTWLNHSFQTRYPGAGLFGQCQTFCASLFLHLCLTFSLPLYNKSHKSYRLCERDWKPQYIRTEWWWCTPCYSWGWWFCWVLCRLVLKL